MTRIFISHSHLDEAIAYKLVTFLLAALELEEKKILCTSNPDQGLSYSSSSVTDQLKEKLRNSDALIILITADSLNSAWIPFEAGSFWTTEKPIIPILGPGLTQNDLFGPLRNLLIIPIDVKDSEDRLNNATNQLAEQLNIQQKFTKRRNNTLKDFSDSLKAWQSKRPIPDSSQQTQIEELKAQIQELERSHSKQLKKIETYQQEKQNLEKQLQQEKQDLQPTAISPFVEKLDSFRFETETVNQNGEVIGRDSSKSAKFFREDLGNGINLEMVYIPGGKFLMGTEDEEIERLVKKFDHEIFRREKPQHEVTVKTFFMGKFQITQAQWKMVASLPKVKQDLELAPSHFKGDNLPVEKVSWKDAVEFCQRLSKQTGREYRLPTEAEWEYAARAGTTTAFHFGETITSNLATYKATNIYANETQGQYLEGTTCVGLFRPNAFGLYDMHGNVWEWCQDDLHSNYIGVSLLSVIVPFGVKKRGGSWRKISHFCRSASRSSSSLSGSLGYIDDGFRVVCSVPKTT